MKKIAFLLLTLFCLTSGSFSCWWDNCGNLYGDVCGCLTDSSMMKVCNDAIQPYMRGTDQGACDAARNRLKPLYCP